MQKAQNRVYKRFRLKICYNASSSRAFFQHEKCMQSVFNVFRWTKHKTGCSYQACHTL
ncbi:unnamed protein product [Staurois parvus]|uniref:Uncharacterized protein n=1 Tax=Staurois parvus TaxID=386267 RepID=A0ABN9AEG0_9NEOB|nr:unnamed protein product [Staurois parvus]